MTVLKNALAVNDGKAVVISIKREWLAKIMSGEKTLEVRKSRPWEISFPFAVFCYETKANGGAGEIIGAFTCEDIDQLNCLTGLSPFVGKALFRLFAFYNNSRSGKCLERGCRDSLLARGRDALRVTFMCCQGKLSSSAQYYGVNFRC